MVQEIDGEDDKDANNVLLQLSCIMKCLLDLWRGNMSNIKSRGTKKTSMDKKGGECT